MRLLFRNSVALALVLALIAIVCGCAAEEWTGTEVRFPMYGSEYVASHIEVGVDEDDVVVYVDDPELAKYITWAEIDWDCDSIIVQIGVDTYFFDMDGW